MSNYTRGLAKDTNNVPLQEYPAPYLSYATYQRENNTASSVISLTPTTSALEVGAFGGQGVVIRWVPISETAAAAGAKASVIASGLTANFDHWIPTGQYRRFVVPRETQGAATVGQMGSVNGLYQRLAIINGGPTASSVLLSEF